MPNFPCYFIASKSASISSGSCNHRVAAQTPTEDNQQDRQVGPPGCAMTRERNMRTSAPAGRTSRGHAVHVHRTAVPPRQRNEGCPLRVFFKVLQAKSHPRTSGGRIAEEVPTVHARARSVARHTGVLRDVPGHIARRSSHAVCELIPGRAPCNLEDMENRLADLIGDGMSVRDQIPIPIIALSTLTAPANHIE